MKILLALLVSLVGISAFGARYIVVFKDANIQNFSQLRRLSQTPFEIKRVHPLLNAALVEANDENLDQISSEDFEIEKEVVHRIPRFVVEPDVFRVELFSDAPPVNWGVEAVKASAAWELGHKGQGSRVLTLDSGADTSHPALKAQIETTKNFLGNGVLPSVKDEIGHGTHVAGTVLSVAPKAKLLIGKVCGSDGECTSSDMIAGIEWGLQQKVDVINLSLGDVTTTPLEKKVIEKAEKTGVIVVAATGNDGEKSVAYPAAYETVVAVGAVNEALKKASFSNWGPELDLMAPGDRIVSATPVDSGKPYSTFSGTSMAAPHVAGVAALVRGSNKALKPAQVQDILKKTATALGTPSLHYGSGLINAEKAVTKALRMR